MPWLQEITKRCCRVCTLLQFFLSLCYGLGSCTCVRICSQSHWQVLTGLRLVEECTLLLFTPLICCFFITKFHIPLAKELSCRKSVSCEVMFSELSILLITRGYLLSPQSLFYLHIIHVPLRGRLHPLLKRTEIYCHQVSYK